MSRGKQLITFPVDADGNTLTTWLKVLGVVGACLFAIGTVVANGSLGNMGSSELAWPPPKAVLTGVWCVVTLAFSMFPVYALYLFIYVRQPSARRHLGGLVILAAASLISALIGSLILRSVFLSDSKDSYRLDITPSGYLFIVKPVVSLPMSL